MPIDYVPHLITPHWSPDGSFILFPELKYSNTERFSGHSYVIESDGTRLREIAKNAYWPSLSPDGSRIAYGTTGGRWEDLPFYIETVNLDGSDRGRFGRIHNFNDVTPAWSPDGQHIAFSRFSLSESDKRGIYTLDLDETALQWLFRPRSRSGGDGVSEIHRWGPVWSPHGDTVAFVIAQGTHWTERRDLLYTVALDRSGLTLLFATEPGTVGLFNRDRIIGKPAWSQDGNRLAFIRHVRPDYYVRKDRDASRVVLHTINADGTDVRVVAELAATVGMRDSAILSWSPNDSHILFTVGHLGLHIADTDDGGYRRVADGRAASWSPNGSRIAVVNDLSEAYLSTMITDGSDVQVLVTRERVRSRGGAILEEAEWGDLKAAR